MTDTFVPGEPGELDAPDSFARAPLLAPARRGAGAAPRRVPPQSIEAETAVLAAMLLDNMAANIVVETLTPDDFYRPSHRTICASCFKLFERNEPIDLLTLAEELGRGGDLEKVGGEIYLAELLDSNVTAANVEYHARIVREKSLLRQMIQASQEIAEEAYGSPDDVNTFLDRAEHRMFAVSESGPRGGFVAIRDLLHDSFEKIEELYRDKRLITGVPTGFIDLDTLTSGFQPSEFVVIAARPSMGKTALTLNIASHVAIEHRRPVAFFSLEMSKESLVHRLLASEARVDGNRLRTGFLRENEWPRLTTAAGKLGDAALYVDDTAGISALEIRAKARRLMVETKGELAMVVVDYLQLIRGHGRTENRQQEISNVSRSLKALAKELRIPVVALSQLRRPTDVKEGMRKPMLSDLRECVPGDTLVVLADGRRVPVQALVGQTPEVVTLGDDRRLTVAKSDLVWKVGRKPVLRVRLASGRSIRATGAHRLLGASGWRKVSELSVGDRLGLARRLPEPVQPERWAELRVALLGQLIGDGSYLRGQPIRYTTQSEENSEVVAMTARTEFGATVKRYRGRRQWHQLLISGNGNRWQPSGVNAWLRHLGVFGQRSHEKRIPEDAFRLANDQVALLLRHLWATDGTIHRRSPKSRGSHVISFSTNSSGLAQDVGALLLRLGLIARTQTVQTRAHRPSHIVSITGAEAQIRFLATIGSFGPRRAQAVALSDALSGVVANTNVDTLPEEVFAQVRNRMTSMGISQRRMAAMRGTSYGGPAHFSFAPSRGLLSQYAELLDDDDLRREAGSDLFWDRVAAIEPAGEEDVYDLTVPGPASWLADGIVSHNSGAIEQDADVVIFIYRPEVYGQADKEGIAEIILGKQRNGPIGNLELHFHKQFTRFENLSRVKE